MERRGAGAEIQEDDAHSGHLWLFHCNLYTCETLYGFGYRQLYGQHARGTLCRLGGGGTCGCEHSKVYGTEHEAGIRFPNL